VASTERLTGTESQFQWEKAALCSSRNSSLAACRSLGEGGGSRRNLKSNAGNPSCLDRSPTGYNCLVTILLPCSTKIPLPN
jgi:hypothetical protein